MKSVVFADRAPVPISPISQATEAMGFVFTAGQVGRTLNGEMKEGMEAQARQALENLSRIMEQAGGGVADVLRLEVLATDLNQMSEFDKVFAECFSEIPPARYCVGVSDLAAGAVIELVADGFVGGS